MNYSSHPHFFLRPESNTDDLWKSSGVTQSMKCTTGCSGHLHSLWWTSCNLTLFTLLSLPALQSDPSHLFTTFVVSVLKTKLRNKSPGTVLCLISYWVCLSSIVCRFWSRLCFWFIPHLLLVSPFKPATHLTALPELSHSLKTTEVLEQLQLPWSFSNLQQTFDEHRMPVHIVCIFHCLIS